MKIASVLSPLRDKETNDVCGRENSWQDLKSRDTISYQQVVRKSQQMTQTK